MLTKFSLSPTYLSFDSFDVVIGKCKFVVSECKWQIEHSQSKHVKGKKPTFVWWKCECKMDIGRDQKPIFTFRHQLTRCSIFTLSLTHISQSVSIFISTKSCSGCNRHDTLLNWSTQFSNEKYSEIKIEFQKRQCMWRAYVYLNAIHSEIHFIALKVLCERCVRWYRIRLAHMVDHLSVSVRCCYYFCCCSRCCCCCRFAFSIFFLSSVWFVLINISFLRLFGLAQKKTKPNRIDGLRFHSPFCLCICVLFFR